MTPSVGQTVHYVIRSGPTEEPTKPCWPAIITAIHPSEGAGTLADLRGPEEVDLAVLDPIRRFVDKVRHSEGARARGTWHWADDGCGN